MPKQYDDDNIFLFNAGKQLKKKAQADPRSYWSPQTIETFVLLSTPFPFNKKLQ